MCMKCKKVYDEDDLPIIDEFNQRGDGCCTIGSLIEYFITPYKYEVSLGKDASREDGKYIIYLDGEKKYIEHNIFIFHSKEKLTLRQVCDKIRFTHGVIKVEGELLTESWINYEDWKAEAGRTIQEES